MIQLCYRNLPAFPLTQLSLILPRRGAALDPAHQRGLAQLTLRLISRGAGGLDNLAFNQKLERLGASITPSVANDYIAIRLMSLTPKLEEALELLLSALLEPALAPAEFESLRSEMVSQWISDREESKRLRAMEVYLERLYGGGPQGWQPDGTRSGLEAATHEDAQALWKTVLPGAKPLLGVLSDLPEEAVRQRILAPLERALNSRLAQPELCGPWPWDGYQPVFPAQNRAVVVADAESQTDEIVAGTFSVAETDPLWHHHQLIGLIFGGDMNSRLFRSIRGERGLSYGASAWYEAAGGRQPRNQVGPFSFYTFPSVEHTAQALPLLLQLYRDLVEKGVTQDELDRARRALIHSHPFRRDTPQKLLGLDLDQALYGLKVDEEAEHRAKLEAVTVEALSQTLARTHHPAKLQLALLGDPARLAGLAAQAGITQVEAISYP